MMKKFIQLFLRFNVLQKTIIIIIYYLIFLNFLIVNFILIQLILEK